VAGCKLIDEDDIKMKMQEYADGGGDDGDEDETISPTKAARITNSQVPTMKLKSVQPPRNKNNTLTIKQPCTRSINAAHADCNVCGVKQDEIHEETCKLFLVIGDPPNATPRIATPFVMYVAIHCFLLD
jgi:hypothetical protein